MEEMRNFNLTPAERKKMVRKSLRVIRGGKDISFPNLDTAGLEEDPFLREHYLGNHHAVQSTQPSRFQEGLRYFLFGYKETPPEAG